MKLAIGLSLICFVLVACAGPAQPTISEVTRQVEVTRVVEVTSQVEVTRLVIVTATSAPTATLTPTETPGPLVVYSVADVIAAFKAAGLPAEEGAPDEPGGIAPSTHTEVYRFLTPIIGPDSGGRVFSFDTQEYLDAKHSYYQSLGQSSGAFFSWLFTRANILVQINGTLPKAEADKYEAALEAMP
jgi:hypothetical protein